MSFSKLDYDEGYYKQYLSQSIGPGVYKLNEPMINCQQCYPYPPTVRLQRQGDSISKSNLLIDIDSELIGITRKFSLDPSKKFIPNCPNSNCNTGEVCGQGVTGRCGQYKDGQRAGDEDLRHWNDCFFPAEYTRLSNPSCNLRSTGWNRWEWLCKDPQERIEMPFDWNISGRILAKDNHRPCIPKPIDPIPSLPTGGPLPCEQLCGNVCAAITTPVSVQWQTADTIMRY